ncbi:hypothetical protein FisN_12Lh228 [Fistulifera solaris]|uniref:Uncharacterized protein n=1 Tax=Fistulifera solaris TaxID=1519565 RepID=A0A1Z5JM33_FISSO|nr:hypothetical protein FisN_12Lh228 [Fistulifera solaris]|eukprot:GAX15075.1 hypothetical protein FisN_12Lh228 [Fistulifera solaris]
MNIVFALNMKASSRTIFSAVFVSVAVHALLLPKGRQTFRLQQSAGDDVIARARENAGMFDVLEPPSLFDDDLLDDMQQALLTMEKRVQQGPGSLTSSEVQDLGARLNRIIQEMKENEHLTARDLLKNDNSHHSTTPVAPAASNTQQSSSLDQLEDDTPSYDGKGGMGQPRGTVNTYIIEGMEEMDSETYRLALQQSIIDRQRERRRSGKVGNRGTIDYLSSLGGKPDRKIMFDPDEKKDTKKK